jgi:hypothetical protein
MKGVSALDFVKDWTAWRTTLKQGIQQAKKLGAPTKQFKTWQPKLAIFW